MQTQLNIRISEEEKLKAEQTARKLGLSLTDLIKIRLKNIQVKDYKQERELVNAIHSLFNQMNRIGLNINQVTKNIHLLKADLKLPENELQQFNLLLSEYNESRKHLFNKIESILP